MLMIRARHTLVLRDVPDSRVTAAVDASGITRNPAFSALVVADGDRVLHSSHASDFGPDRPHSIQSVTKLHAHLILGELIASGRVDPNLPVARYLPWIGTAFATASVQDVLDMNVYNDFTEDYDDPHSGCYAEEEALGWRLPPDDRAELTMRDFAAGLTGRDPVNRTGYALYKSANFSAGIGTDAWFFREGEGKKYEAARFGLFRVGQDGQMILVGLAGEDLQQIE